MKFTKKIVVALSIAAAVVGLVLILHVNLLFPWQQESRKNKQAILEYVNENYPGAKIVSQSYDYGFKLRPRKNDVIDFKWDDIEFHVSADDGKIVRDSYPEARATAQFDKIIKDGFLRPRQITSAVSSYTFYDDYIEPYTGEVTIELDIVGEGVIPQKIEWLYDFYKYWKKEGAFLREYQVYLVIYETNSKEDSYIIIKKDSEFADENEFYSAFKKYW